MLQFQSVSFAYFFRFLIPLFLSLFFLSACGGSSTGTEGNAEGSTGGTTQSLPDSLSFNAWIGKDDSILSLMQSLPTGVELYSFRNADCDINNISACDEGHKLRLNGQNMIDNALTLSTPAYYKARHQGQSLTSSLISASKFTPRFRHQMVYFKAAFWLIGGEGDNRKNDIWTSPDGLNWVQVIPQGTHFSARSEHQVVVFKDKLWVLGGDDNSSNKNDVWSSSDGIHWTEELADNGSPPATQFTSRNGHQALVFKDKLWVIGGYSGLYKNDVWSSSDGKTWTKELENVDSPPATQFSGRGSHQVLVFKDKLWVIGGYEKNDVWSSSDGKTWTEELVHNYPVPATQFSPRYGHQALVFKDKLWVIGGHGSGNKNDIWSSSDGKTWTKEKEHAAFSARNSHQALAVNNQLWLIGGHSGSGGYNNDIWTSADGKTWQEQKIATHAFTPRTYHQAVVFNKQFWVIGGYDGSVNNDIWHSSDGVSWQKVKVQGIHFSPRAGHQVVVFNNKLWVIAGGLKSSTFIPKAYTPSRARDVWSSADGIKWKLETDSPNFARRSNHQAFVFDNKIWITGGKSDGPVLSDVWHSADGQHWTEVMQTFDKALGKRSYHQALVFKNKLWVLAGYDIYDGSSDTNSIYVSKDKGVSWKTITPTGEVFSTRAGHQAVVFKDKLWVIGGNAGGSRQNDVYRSDDGIAWVKLTASAPFSKRSAHQIRVFQDKLWLFGGEVADGAQNDVWQSEDGINWRKAVLGRMVK